MLKVTLPIVVRSFMFQPQNAKRFIDFVPQQLQLLVPVEIHTFVVRLSAKAKSVYLVYKAPPNLTEHQSFIGVLISKKP